MKILLVDDQTLVREGLKMGLSAYPDVDIEGVMANKTLILTQIKRRQPDLVLIDIALSKKIGLACVKAIRETYPQLKIAVISSFENDDFIFALFQYDISGYFKSRISMDKLYRNLLTIIQGGAVVDPMIAQKVFSRFATHARADERLQTKKASIDNLSQTEWTIIRLVGLGQSNREIAKSLYLSEGTVRNYLSVIFQKLHVHDRTQLAIWTMQDELD